jgi:hypothetical protein
MNVCVYGDLHVNYILWVAPKTLYIKECQACGFRDNYTCTLHIVAHFFLSTPPPPSGMFMLKKTSKAEHDDLPLPSLLPRPPSQSAVLSGVIAARNYTRSGITGLGLAVSPPPTLIHHNFSGAHHAAQSFARTKPAS